MAKAAADAQAIFKGDCAACHAEKARGLLGKELYAAACGICHDSPRRAAFVPDLHGLKQPADLDYWKTIIARGKPHTMMPGFATRGGRAVDGDAGVFAGGVFGEDVSGPAARRGEIGSTAVAAIDRRFALEWR